MRHMREIALMCVLALAVQCAPIQESLDADAVVPEDPEHANNNHIPESELVAFGDVFDPDKWGSDLGLSPPPPPPPCNPGDCCDAIESKIHQATDKALQKLPSITHGMAREGIEEGVRREMKKKGIKMCEDYKKENKCKDKAAIAGCAQTCGACTQAAALKKDDPKEIKAVTSDINSVEVRIEDVAAAAKQQAPLIAAKNAKAVEKAGGVMQKDGDKAAHKAIQAATSTATADGAKNTVSKQDEKEAITAITSEEAAAEKAAAEKAAAAKADAEKSHHAAMNSAQKAIKSAKTIAETNADHSKDLQNPAPVIHEDNAATADAISKLADAAAGKAKATTTATSDKTSGEATDAGSDKTTSKAVETFKKSAAANQENDVPDKTKQAATAAKSAGQAIQAAQKLAKQDTAAQKAKDAKEAADSAAWANDAVKAVQDAKAADDGSETKTKEAAPAPKVANPFDQVKSSPPAPKVGPATLPTGSNLRGDGKPVFTLPINRLLKATEQSSRL